MTTRRGNPDQYLQRVGNTYYARVRVPRTLDKFVGQTHIRRSLKTSSRAEANLRKHAVVAQMKAELAELRKSPPPADGSGLTFADARAIREQLERLRLEGEHDDAATIELKAIDHAEKLEALYGSETAHRWFRKATATGDSLKELHDRWLEANDYKESTNAGHRKALQEVLDYMRNDEARPGDVTLQVALHYIDHELLKRGLAYNTIRDRLVSLGGFWRWMGTRGAVPRGVNPWANQKVSKKQNAGSRPPKRGYTDDELQKLLEGNQTVKGWPTYSYIPDLVILGMFTGARIESLCSLRAEHAEETKAGYVLFVPDTKTKAGRRFVALTHPAPVAALKRRIAGRKGKDLLFAELSPGGLDEKLSSSASKAFGRYRRACQVPDGTDYHSFRRSVVTVLEHAKVDQVSIARFVGHKVGTLAADTYSDGGSREMALEVAKSIRYSRTVEEAAVSLGIGHRNVCRKNLSGDKKRGQRSFPP